ncbi:hypothetical protein AALP_AA8G328500 [Arabis alpina]|uniref:KIB1-4 beta-propeller domain-containing protein n=1 Tax=Arabis alpina TaxID=50452 RepID=A0A087GB02_ARAAL|nr:hypothetical protein AALP_AA8G328500 [Arabis alpina]
MDSCLRTEHLVESIPTGETFLVKWYRQATASGNARLKTKALMVFELDKEGNAVYTNCIGDLCIFLSKSEPFCVSASSFPGMSFNAVKILDAGENGIVTLYFSSIISGKFLFDAPYHIPPQNCTCSWRNFDIISHQSPNFHKTLLTLLINGNFKGKGEDSNLALCLDKYTVQEQTMCRWTPVMKMKLQMINQMLPCPANLSTSFD